MALPKNEQGIKQLNDGDSCRTPSGDLMRVYKRRNSPPQLYFKILDEGYQTLHRAWNVSPTSVQLFHKLAKRMNKNNILRISLEEIAKIDEITYHQASVKMSTLCDVGLISRTGTRSMWMINPIVATKCSEDECVELRIKWFELLEAIAERKKAKQGALPTGTLGLEGEKESSTTKESNNVSA